MRALPKKTISRAFLYIRTLEGLIKEKRSVVSSRELAEIIGLTDVQIRKDISSFGKVGLPRVGYRVDELKNTLEEFILGKKGVRIALFGVGNLGSAILKYSGFQSQRVRILAAFEKNPEKIGTKINGVSVYAFRRAPEVIKRIKADIGIIAVPAEFSQEAADIMVRAGLKGIMNFAPASISVPKRISVKDIDLAIEFLSLYCETQN